MRSRGGKADRVKGTNPRAINFNCTLHDRLGTAPTL